MSSVIAGAQPASLVYQHERPLFAIAATISIAFWAALLIGTFGVALIFVALAFIFYLFAQSALISHLRGTGTSITAEQFPDLHQRIKACAEKLGVYPVPDAYLLHGDGVFNAFATRFLGRNFIVLLSDVVDALESEPEALDFYIGHELGHIRRSHLLWGPILLPASILPLIGAAYSRSREYTCDLHGLACCASSQAAARGLAALAAGSKRWRTIDADRYASQAEASGGFWMSFHELISSYPWLVKRMAHILGPDHVARIPGRNPLAWILALFVPRLAYGGAASLMVTIAVIGILAAVAIPAYQDYTVRAKIAGALIDADRATASVEQYYYRNNRIPPSLELAGFFWQPGPVIRAVDLDSTNGVLRIQLAFPPVEGNSFTLAPSLDSNRRVVWKCSAGDVPVRYMPQRCR